MAMRAHPRPDADPRRGSTWALVVAAGRGLRMGQPTPKQFLEVAGRPLVAHTLDALLAHPEVEGAVMAIPRGAKAMVETCVLARLASGKPVRLVTGGDSRASSVAKGLAGLPARASVVLVHDGARPLVARALLDRLLAAVAEHGAAIPALPATDTLKERTRDGFVRRTLARDLVVAVQTPQAFRRAVLQRAFDLAGDALDSATDCSGLVERTGVRVALVPGERDNVKVTDPADLALVVSRLATRPRAVAGSV